MRKWEICGEDWKCDLTVSWGSCAVPHSCLTLCDLMDCSAPGFPVLHHPLRFTHVHWVAMPSNHLILSHPLLLLHSVLPSSRVFSSESALCIKWPKCGSFGVSASNEYSGLISFRMDWFDHLAVQGTLKSLLQHHRSKSQFYAQLSLWSDSHIHTWLREKP